MRAEKDFAEFLELFNKNEVRYCIIGAFAVGFYGYPRYTKNMDILIEPSPENARKIIRALKEFGFAGSNLTEQDFAQKEKVIQLGCEPVRIDLLTSIKGFSFSRIWKNKTIGRYGRNQKVFFIGRKQLLESKKRCGRDIDIIDLKKLSRRNR